jgi:hypothetical protein
LRTTARDILDPHRGSAESQYVHALSHISAETEDTNAIVMGLQTQTTAREQQNRLPIPTKRSLNSNLVLPTLEVTSCSREEVGVEPWRYLTPTYYTEKSIH